MSGIYFLPGTDQSCDIHSRSRGKERLCGRERENVCVCVCERVREREGVCVSERKRERGRERDNLSHKIRIGI